MWWAHLVSMPPSYNIKSVFPTCEVHTTMTPSHRLRPDASPNLFFIPILLFIRIYSYMTLWPHLVKYNLNLGFFLNQNCTWKNSRTHAKIIRKRNFILSLCISFFGNEVSGNGRDWSQLLCMKGTSGTHWLRKQWKLWKKKINSQGNWDLYPVLSGNLVS